ncbi:MAG: PKD domain-containing protein, partial [Haliscomenobacteraceae bacterium CHB4]|nr:PKD domain-containing protein [Haliscomenobacteraceae bacterium CHB4]
MLAANLKYDLSYYPNIWCQTVLVEPNTDYYFSWWATKLSTPNGFISFSINGTSVSSINLNSSIPKCEWVNKNGIWNSGNNTSATLCIRNLKWANILAIDDIFFGPFCTVRDTVTVFVKNVKAVVTPSGYPIPCDGTETTLSGAGSSTGPGISYQWSTPDGKIVSGENTLNPVVNAPGTYTLTVTLLDAIGNCTKTATTEVFLNNVLEIGIDAPPTLNCYLPYVILKGLSNQTTSTYQWTAGPGGNIVSGANTATARVDQPGEYTLLVTNTATGCTAETSVVIDPPTLPAAVAAATPITCASQQSTLSGAGSSNGPNFTYAWSTPNGNIVSGQNSLNASADAPGDYILAVTNTLSNCSATDTVTVTAVNALPQVNVLPADMITCLQNNITLQTDSATAGAHLIYAWTASNGGNIVSGADSLAPVVNAPGLYILSVTDTLNACTGTDSVWVAADTDAVIAIAGANGSLTCVNNTVTLNANGSSMDTQLVYQWTTQNGNILSGANSPNPVVDAPGEYQLLLTNPANGCSATDMVGVTQNTAIPQANILPHAPLSCAVPLLVLQGQNAAPAGNFLYSWTAQNGGHIVAGDNNGCTATTATDVSADFNAPDAALTVSGVLNCHNPAVNLLNSGSGDPALLNHEWTTPDGSVVNTGADPSLDAQLPGNYALLISNTQNGCTATAAATVVQHEPVTVTPTAQADASCFGAADGAAAVVAAGGDGSYSFLWSNGETT